MTETKFDSELPTIDARGIPLTGMNHDDVCAGIDQIINLNLQLSFNRPIDELLNYANSDPLSNGLTQVIDWQYKFAMSLMRVGMYTLAIQFFELALHILKFNETVSCDLLLKSRYYIQLGHCYRQLKLYDTALENYQLALGQSIHLPLVEYIQTVIEIGTLSEIKNNYEQALNQYIEIEEIYQGDSTLGTLKQRSNIEESIRRVISHICPMN